MYKTTLFYVLNIQPYQSKSIMLKETRNRPLKYDQHEVDNGVKQDRNLTISLELFATHSESTDINKF